MLIAVTGPKSAGKSTLVNFFVAHHGFRRVTLASHASRPENAETNAFESVDALLEFLMADGRWDLDWCVEWRGERLDLLRKRPFFVLVYIDAPASLRNARNGADCSVDDDGWFATLARLATFADLKVLNEVAGLEQWERHLKCNLPVRLLRDRMRPSWDTYFMHLAHLASRRSNCMKRRVGCILVKNCRVIATGYNGTPRGVRNCNEGGCVRCNNNARAGVGLDTCLCLHAEENALLEAGRERYHISRFLGGANGAKACRMPSQCCIARRVRVFSVRSD